jgi:hypothetical protein
MAKLSAFRQDAKAIAEGEWMRVGEEYGDLEIHSRGFTDEYFDAQAALQRQAAVGLGVEVSRLPSKVRRRINIDCLIQHVVLDVRNLTHDDGPAVTFDEFCGFLRDPSYVELVTACFKAAGKVGQRRTAELEDALGN